MNTLTHAKTRLKLTRSLLNSFAVRRELDPETVSQLSPAQKEKLKAELLARVEHSTYEEKPGLLEKVALLNGNETLRREIWEENHRTVVSYLAEYFSFHGFMPTNKALAEKTGLSRSCVIRHLTTYREEPEYEIQMAKMRIMKTKLMEKVLGQGMEGDVQAAKVYIDAVSRMEDKESRAKAAVPDRIRQQNNYFQVNGVVISQEKLEQLAPEQMKVLEGIFKDH